MVGVNRGERIWKINRRYSIMMIVHMPVHSVVSHHQSVRAVTGVMIVLIAESILKPQIRKYIWKCGESYVSLLHENVQEV